MSGSKKIPVRKMTIKKVGIIDFDGLYKTMQKWFYEQKFVFEEPTSRIRKGTPAGVEYEFKWWAWRKVDVYAKYHMHIWFYLYDVKEIEVIKNGKKITLTKCRLQIEMDGHVELDWTKKFQNSKFQKLLFDFLNNFILQEEKVISMYWDELYYRMYKLQTIVKELLDMESRGNAYYDMW